LGRRVQESVASGRPSTAGETVSYFLEAPSSPGEFTFGPARVEHDGSTATFGGTSDERVVPGENGLGGSPGL
jgi:hypothetical protein